MKKEEAVGRKLLDFVVPEDRDSCNMEYIGTVDNLSDVIRWQDIN